MLSLADIYTLYFRLYFRLCICLNKLSINKRYIFIKPVSSIENENIVYNCDSKYTQVTKSSINWYKISSKNNFRLYIIRYPGIFITLGYISIGSMLFS